MKQVSVKKGVVLTPWLNVDEAMAYCGFGYTEFYKRAAKSNLPICGEGKAKRYDSKILDKWIQSNYGPYPFSEPQPLSSTLEPQPRRNHSRPNVLVNPRNGRVYAGKDSKSKQEGVRK